MVQSLNDTGARIQDEGHDMVCPELLGLYGPNGTDVPGLLSSRAINRKIAAPPSGAGGALGRNSSHHAVRRAAIWLSMRVEEPQWLPSVGKYRFGPAQGVSPADEIINCLKPCGTAVPRETVLDFLHCNMR